MNPSLVTRVQITEFIGTHEGAWHAQCAHSVGRGGDGPDLGVDPSRAVVPQLQPRWSPDGAWLVFESVRDGNGEIYRVRPDGSGMERLTDTPADETHPSYRPDGSRIVFDRNVDGVWSVWTIRPDGTDLKPLVAAPTDADSVAWARHPSFSPDGTRLAFDSDRDGDVEIYVMELSSGEVRRITRNPAHDTHQPRERRPASG